MNESPISQMQPVSRVSTISRRLASKVLSMIENNQQILLLGLLFAALGRRTVPPRRRFLKFSSKKKKHRATKNGSNGFDHDGTISSNSTLTETGSSITASTPPVARILPSSFFKQLASSNESSTRTKSKSRGQRRKRGISPKIGDLRLDMARKESNFSEITRKLMPPKVSVRDLKERFQEAERAYTHKDLKLEELDGSSRARVRLRGNVIPKEGKATSKHFLREKLMSGGIDGSFTSFAEDQNSGYRDNNSDFFYEAFDKEGLHLSNCESTGLMCRDDMNYLNTEYHCMADGSLSNFGTYAQYWARFCSGDEEDKVSEENEADFYAARHSIAVDIVSPKPMNAVQAAQLRSMVFRYT
ncbi:uncharacterized protein H6S33_002703 [Morchella sextelata]|uniref:uncharacterized protein n=1 Tax=Morchella sextelata TaxID=1174677 RepID=UPI001D05157B|nr:uncharacterized protein H6S33_002703 [Morchella sextelata]KAH0607669.1 hypothetical protein H6S33_002703 [Morchella sextelata]